MENLPFFILVAGMGITLLTLFLFYKAANGSKKVLGFSLIWLSVQGGVSLTGFYSLTNTLPPRFTLLLLPPVAFIIILFLTKSGKTFMDGLNIKWMTILHIVRVPVEMILLWLFFHSYVPRLMTFEGRNYDILSGITSPLIYYFAYINKKIARRSLLVWNFICLALLLNILINAVFAAPFVFQQFAFDQPNIAVLYFPFTWLPCFIVPVVLLAHLASIRQLTMGMRKRNIVYQ